MLPIQFYIYCCLPVVLWWAVFRKNSIILSVFIYVRKHSVESLMTVFIYGIGIELLVRDIEFWFLFFLNNTFFNQKQNLFFIKERSPTSFFYYFFPAEKIINQLEASVKCLVTYYRFS